MTITEAIGFPPGDHSGEYVFEMDLEEHKGRGRVTREPSCNISYTVEHGREFTNYPIWN